MSLLGVKGRQVGEVMDRVSDWQLAHPAGTKEECIAWVTAAHEQ
jgi:tRNA nucleotidyltransferase (CCA-adding enzyme)